MKFSRIVATAAILFVAVQSMAQTQTEKPSPPDWIVATNKPCKIWNPQPQADEAVTWSGACKDGYASGKGILFWTVNGKPDVEFDGEYQNGKRNGPGVIILPNGDRIEGVWVNDEILAKGGDAI